MTPPGRLVTVLLGIGYPDRLNGAQIGLLAVARRLRERGYRPILVTTGEGRTTDAFRGAEIDVRVLAASREFNRFNKEWLGGGALWKLRALAVGLPRLTIGVYRLVRSEDVKLVHVNEPRALLLFGWGAKLARRPLVLHARGSMGGVYPKGLWEAIQRMPDLIVRDGDAIKVDMRAAGRSKTRVVYEGTESKVERAEHGAANGPAIVVTLASFIPYKGYHHLLEAVPLVNQQLGEQHVRFVWCGQTLDRAYAAQLRARVQELRVRNLDLRNWAPNVDEILHGAALYVQPTVEHERIEIGGEVKEIWSAEGIPRSVLEALAWGVPAVASAVGSMGEAVIDGATGALVPPGDPHALADAIVRLVRDPTERERLGSGGISLVRQRFAPEATVAGITDLYVELGVSPEHASASSEREPGS